MGGLVKVAEVIAPVFKSITGEKMPAAAAAAAGNVPKK